jgi:Ni/Co efflux regulator RcnB
MKKFIAAAVAAVIATGSVGVASAAEAQSRGNSYAQQQRHDDRNDRRDYRTERRDDRAYARYQRAERRYSAGRYVAPRGYQVRQWSYGQRLPAAYATRTYVVNDYNRYGLRAPPRGYQYVRSGNDVVLAAVAGGLITAVIAGLFN